MTDHEKRVLDRVEGILTSQDKQVALLGFDFLLDVEGGYGPYVDGQEGNINNAQTYLLARVIGQPVKPLVAGSQNYLDENGDRGFWEPEGYEKQDVWSADFMSGNNFPKGWTYQALEEIGVALEDIPRDRFYKGLNIDEDCAVSELLTAVASAYSWYAEDFDWEFLEERSPAYVKRFKDLGLTPELCRDSYYRLMKIADSVRQGKHDRNEQLWC